MSQHDAELRKLHIGERDYIGFRFEGGDLPEGVIVSSSTVAVSPAAGLTLDSATGEITDENDGTYAWITGATVGDYIVKFTIIFSDTKDLIRTYPVRVIP